MLELMRQCKARATFQTEKKSGKIIKREALIPSSLNPKNVVPMIRV
jgi:hypothetical protein